MTNEEAIEELEKDIKWAEQKKPPYMTLRRVEAVRVAIKALSQEPCEDCGSFMYWIDETKNYIKFKFWDGTIKTARLGELRDKLLNETQPKTGHWEWVQYDANPEIGNFHCSECRYIPAIFNMSAQKLNYCPKCGAKME